MSALLRPLEFVADQLRDIPASQKALRLLREGKEPNAPQFFLYIVRHIWAKETGEGIDLRRKKEYSLKKLRQKFLGLGYEESPLVYQPGQVSFRGEIVDFWDKISLYPTRLEFFDRLLERIYFFDLRSKRPLKELQSFFVYPVVFPSFPREEFLKEVREHSCTSLKDLLRLTKSKKAKIFVFSQYSEAIKELGSSPKAKVYFLPPVQFHGFSVGNWHFFTDKDFKRKVRVRRFAEIEDFGVGDYVVHIDHGIAKLQGIGPKKLPLALDERLLGVGERKDFYYHLRFKDGFLYVPLTEKRRITRYVGSSPRLSRLGGREWEIAKLRASEEAE
ncbi:hypothetical protein J7L13_02115, partial [bacterium]|nr:hypothetical protein [bacterium]